MNGGPLIGQPQLCFPTVEVTDILQIKSEKTYENLILLTDLYLKKHWSLRRISKELGCSKGTVRRNLIRAQVPIETLRTKDTNKQLKAKIISMRQRGLSYQSISDAFNKWKISTRTGEGVWHAKTVRELIL